MNLERYLSWFWYLGHESLLEIVCFWESVCYKHVDVEYLRYFEWFDLLILMELFWTRVWKKSTTWLILIDGKHDGSWCIFIYYWNCFVVDCLWNDLIYIVITSLCGFDIDSPTPIARIGRLSPTWVVRWTPCSSHGLCRL